jgi:hypothetical protein
MIWPMPTAQKTTGTANQDSETQGFLQHLSDNEKVAASKIPGVKTVLVVLSSRSMAFDRESLRHQILMAYQDSAVFFKNTNGSALGAEAPSQVDLLIDFTGAKQRQSWLYSRKLRRISRFAVGRNAGFFRKQIYDRVFDEKLLSGEVELDLNEKERRAQKAVLALAGIAVAQQGDPTPDLSHTIGFTAHSAVPV